MEPPQLAFCIIARIAARRLLRIPFHLGDASFRSQPARWREPQVRAVAALWFASERPRSRRFLAAARTLVPALRRDDLHPGGTGIRDRGAPADIGSDWPARRLVQVAGIDSLGLTACLAIRRGAAELVDAVLDSGEDER